MKTPYIKPRVTLLGEASVDPTWNEAGIELASPNEAGIEFLRKIEQSKAQREEFLDFLVECFSRRLAYLLFR
jgi:hypothetical protein